MSAGSRAAFARPESEKLRESWSMKNSGQEGLTKREYFAARAMQSVILSSSTRLTDPASIATLSFRIADAMVAHLDAEAAALRAGDED